MYLPPSGLWGYDVRARGRPQPIVIADARIPIQEGDVVRVRFLRWRIEDFEIPDSELSDLSGWFLTLALERGDARWHLIQGKSVFYSTHPEDVWQSVPEAQVRDSGPRPRWKRRSDRWWPERSGVTCRYLGQVSTGVHHVYLFGDLVHGELAAYVDGSLSQDVEDHYDSEEG